jgi:hypothetical protein
MPDDRWDIRGGRSWDDRTISFPPPFFVPSFLAEDEDDDDEEVSGRTYSSTASFDRRSRRMGCEGWGDDDDAMAF